MNLILQKHPKDKLMTKKQRYCILPFSEPNTRFVNIFFKALVGKANKKEKSFATAYASHFLKENK